MKKLNTDIFHNQAQAFLHGKLNRPDRKQFEAVLAQNEELQAFLEKEKNVQEAIRFYADRLKLTQLYEKYEPEAARIAANQKAKKHNQKGGGNRLRIIAASLLIIICAGSIFYWQNNINKQAALNDQINIDNNDYGDKSALEFPILFKAMLSVPKVMIGKAGSEIPGQRILVIQRNNKNESVYFFEDQALWVIIAPSVSAPVQLALKELEKEGEKQLFLYIDGTWYPIESVQREQVLSPEKNEPILQYLNE